LEEEMASKIKLTVSLDEALVRELESDSRRTRKPRSQLVEEAIRHWHRSRLEQELKEGYQAMAAEDRATARRNLAVGWEAIK
jgi:metal-responsive CopG/Arc/MetJ family transcriptional regulator